MSAVIDMAGVGLTVDGRVFLDGVDLQVQSGQTVVIASPPGSGKSFLLRLVLGLPGLRPDRYHLRGRIAVEGQDLGSLSGARLQALRRRLGSVLRQGGLIENMDIRGNIMLPLTYHWRDTLGGAWIEARCDAVLADLGQSHLGRPGLRPVYLHREERIYAALARALVCEPAILLFDEPGEALSPGAARRLWPFLFEYEPTFAPRPGDEPGRPVARLPRTRLVTTADLGNYLGVGDRFLLLWDGRLHDLGDAQMVRTSADPRLRQVLAEPAPPVAAATGGGAALLQVGPGG